MNIETFDTLNNIYKPIWEKSIDIKNRLCIAGYEVTNGFYNNHYIKYNNDFIVEHFPIPVISIIDMGDIGIDIDSIWVEIKLTKDDALLLNYPNLAGTYNMEVYGADDYLLDFYNTQSDPYEVADKIRDSRESQICVTFYFEIDIDTDELVKLIKNVRLC